MTKVARILMASIAAAAGLSLTNLRQCGRAAVGRLALHYVRDAAMRGDWGGLPQQQPARAVPSAFEGIGSRRRRSSSTPIISATSTWSVRRPTLRSLNGTGDYCGIDFDPGKGESSTWFGGKYNITCHASGSDPDHPGSARHGNGDQVRQYPRLYAEVPRRISAAALSSEENMMSRTLLLAAALTASTASVRSRAADSSIRWKWDGAIRIVSESAACQGQFVSRGQSPGRSINPTFDNVPGSQIVSYALSENGETELIQRIHLSGSSTERAITTASPSPTVGRRFLGEWQGDFQHLRFRADACSDYRTDDELRHPHPESSMITTASRTAR